MKPYIGSVNHKPHLQVIISISLGELKGCLSELVRILWKGCSERDLSISCLDKSIFAML